jgi:hypothetical protein
MFIKDDKANKQLRKWSLPLVIGDSNKNQCKSYPLGQLKFKNQTITSVAEDEEK